MLAGTPPTPGREATFRIGARVIEAVPGGPGSWTVRPIAGRFVKMRVETPGGAPSFGTPLEPGEPTEVEVLLPADR
ncbi:MAG TPA: hypothetical protein ENJ09_15790 [Planctomycetes bacterium]|nr:hypothetical protein [Planctomycetota bacterium]